MPFPGLGSDQSGSLYSASTESTSTESFVTKSTSTESFITESFSTESTSTERPKSVISHTIKRQFILESNHEVLSIPEILYWEHASNWTANGFVAFEADLKDILCPLAANLRSAVGRIQKIIQSTATEKCLNAYCDAKYGIGGYNNKNYTLPPIPGLLRADKSGLINWFVEIFRFKFTFLVSDRVLWQPIKAGVELAFSEANRKQHQEFYTIISDNTAFDTDENYYLRWNLLFETLDAYEDSERQENLNGLTEEFRWLDRSIRFIYSGHEQADLYFHSVKVLLEERSETWFETNSNIEIWRAIFPYIRLMVFAVVERATVMIGCDPFCHNKPSLFGFNVKYGLKKILVELYRKIEQRRRTDLVSSIYHHLSVHSRLIDIEEEDADWEWYIPKTRGFKYNGQGTYGGSHTLWW